jgi:hypothetical protein
MSNIVIKFIILSLGVHIFACNGDTQEPVSCEYCPNNTKCLEDKCVCPPGNTNMGSWCIPVDTGIFVVETLGIPCFETFGIEFSKIQPEPLTHMGTAQSLYSMYSRPNTRSSIFGLFPAPFSYYDLPDGDSILVRFFKTTGSGFPSSCDLPGGRRCSTSLGGRFISRDSIRGTIRWHLCNDSGAPPVAYPVLMVRR